MVHTQGTMQASRRTLKYVAWLLVLSCHNGEGFMVTAKAPWTPRTSSTHGEAGVSASVSPNTNTAMQSSLSTTQPSHQAKAKSSISTPAYPSNRAKVEVSSEIELPFPADVAFDAFADLRRQPVYSSWLNNVEYLDGSDNNTVGTKSKWTISVLGFKFSWNSISLRQDKESGVIEWGSLSGLKNQGCVEFSPLDKSKTHMKLTMTIFMPRFAARMMSKKNQSVARMIEHKMLKGTLEKFRDDVLQNEMRSPLIDLMGAETSLSEESSDQAIGDDVDYAKEIRLVRNQDSLLSDTYGTEFRPVVPQD